MNNAHLHLLVNHLPFLALVIGSVVVLAGFLLKNRDVRLTGLGIFIFGSLTSIPAFYTGEGAEDIVENLPGISEASIHDHEELAELFLNLMLVLGIFSIITFIIEVKKIRYSNLFMVVCLLIAVASGILAGYVGNTGGKIIHSEITSTVRFIEN
ncbi:hypothetical protein [Christiangramia crocea]|uniref:DUF2231 domain-containing protein n=1 Tax=Christiangramia crocea TaxID=2904124 RepID=A0A9X2A6D7_9FLAO|nr:hypothetical protein [Gramella crocea]MCG9970906.1 hypothetical protein [Gramella crocea]